MNTFASRLVAAALAITLCACEKQMHDMYAQPRYRPQDPSPLFADAGADRTPPGGTVVAARGPLAMTSSGRAGFEDSRLRERDLSSTSNPYPVTRAFLERGRQRHDIYCAPCHGAAGDGDGYIVRRGFPAPPSYDIERLRAADDRHIVDVITDGTGRMYPFADRVTPADRWAMAAWVRVLQLSQRVSVSQLPPEDVAVLAGMQP